MSAVDPIGITSTVPGQKTEVPEKAALGQDAFLTLLVTQLQYQDPLNPMEGTEFTAQLAQFSSLEQLTNVNDNLNYLLLYQSSLNNAQAVNFMGKTVTAVGDTVSLTAGEAGNIQFDQGGSSNDTKVYIYDGEGNLVRTIDCGALDSGKHQIQWDGMRDDGSSLADGAYTFDVVATDAEGNTVPATTFIETTVTGVTFEKGTTYLLSGDMRIALGDVIEVTETAAGEDG